MAEAGYLVLKTYSYIKSLLREDNVKGAFLYFECLEPDIVRFHGFHLD